MNEIAAFLVTIRYWTCGVFTKIRNHVDKYVITKHYYQLMPLSLGEYKYNCGDTSDGEDEDKE
ncbi:hypothetical protein T03_13998, partial [Trichinella britovi]